jgi:hypothetical protein
VDNFRLIKERSKELIIESGNFEKLRLEIPQKGTVSLGLEWFGRWLFTKFKFEDFYKLYCAILNEKSVVFICQNLNTLTGIINGFRMMMLPFKWHYIYIPIIPKVLIDSIYAPQPLFVGIPDISYINDIEMEYVGEKIIVFCDNINEDDEVEPFIQWVED